MLCISYSRLKAVRSPEENVDTLSLSSEVTTLLSHVGVVSQKCQVENNPRKSPEACISLDTQNYNLRGFLQTMIADSLTTFTCV